MCAARLLLWQLSPLQKTQKATNYVVKVSKITLLLINDPKNYYSMKNKV